MMIKIETDIPPPNSVELDVALGKMQQGNSFYIDEISISARNYLYTQLRKLKPKRFVTRLENNGLRVWRVQ